MTNPQQHDVPDAAHSGSPAGTTLDERSPNPDDPNQNQDGWISASWSPHEGPAQNGPVPAPQPPARTAPPIRPTPPPARPTPAPAGQLPPAREPSRVLTTPPSPEAAGAPDPSTSGVLGGRLDERSIVRERADRPGHGWRAGVFRLSGGLVNPGPSAADKERQELLNRIRRPLRGAHRIAVASSKGGVGKTTVAACLGLVLSENRGDRVIALDANPDAGTLADRLTAETAVTVRDLLDNIEATQSLTDVARYTSLAGRLQVLASEQDPAASEAFDRDEYERVCAVLTRFYNIAITDSGTGLVHSAMDGTLGLADSLVVVGAPTVDGASRAAQTLDWLVARGRSTQVERAMVVLSCDRWSKEVDRTRIREYFATRCRAVVEVPFDPHLATGGRIQLPELRPATVDAFLHLAAHVADGFGRDPLRTAD